MSRYTIEAKDPERFTIVVGYDGALTTYFGQVIDRQIEREEEEQAARIIANEQEEDDDTPERDPVVLWVGTSVGEVPSVTELTRLVKPYAVVVAPALANQPKRRRTARGTLTNHFNNGGCVI